MRSTLVLSLAAALAVAVPAAAEAGGTKHRHRAAREAEHPLTIGGRHRGYGPIVVRGGGREIYAPGGFSAHGFGYGPPGSEMAERAARNAEVRYRTGGVYGYGLDGVGGIGFGDGLESGYNNPYYGNSYNRYVGYNGVPTDLAFGPAFADRHIAADDDDAPASLGPQELGYEPLP